MASIVLARAVAQHGRTFGARLRAHLGRIPLQVGPFSAEDEAILLGATPEAALGGSSVEAIARGATAEAITQGAANEAVSGSGGRDGVLR